MNKKFYFVWFALFCAISIYAQEIVSYSSVNNTGCSGIVANDANVTALGICRGSGITRKASATYNSQNWTPNTTLDADDYLEWNVTPNFGYQLDFSTLDIRYDRSNNGPQTIELYIDTGSGFSLLFTDNNVDTNGENNSLDLSSYTALINTVTFRLYGYNATNGTGTLDIETFSTANKGIIINGTVTQICPTTTTWDGSAWSNGVPNINKSVIINGDYNTSAHGSFSACSLVVNSTFSLTINNSNYVEVEKDVLVDGSVQVETKGAFIQNDDLGTFSLGASGSSQVNKFTEPLTTWRDYTYWSSPVVNTTINGALSTSVRRYYYDAANYLDTNGDGLDDDFNDWQIAAGTSTMTPGVGYVGSHTPIGFFSGAKYQYNFLGAFNTGNISVPVAYNPINTRHWNLLGNPYPCALDVDDFFNQNYNGGAGVVDGILYLWSHSTPASTANTGNDGVNYSISDYAIINIAGEVAGADGKTPDRYIPSGQGFFIPSIAAGSVTFNNAMRIVGENSNDLFFKQGTEIKEKTISSKAYEKERLWLNLSSNNGVSNEILMAYLNEATDGNDGLAFDAQPIYSGYANIYTSIEEDNTSGYAIQSKSLKKLKHNARFKLGFNNWIEEPTLFSISVSKMEGSFLSSHNIYIKDHLLKTTHNLNESEYEFTSSYGVHPDRFTIFYKKNNINKSVLSTEDKDLEQSLSIIERANDSVEFLLKSHLDLKEIKVYDLLGRELYDFEAKGKSKLLNISKISSGAYIAKVKLNNGVVITKKAIKS